MTRFQLSYLRVLGTLEGLSLIFLLFIAMPLRSLTHDATLVRDAGSIHGLLFIIYVFTLIDSASLDRWSKKCLFIGIALSCLPFGTFWFDRRYLEPMIKEKLTR